jgi:hypothetical protein
VDLVARLERVMVLDGIRPPLQGGVQVVGEEGEGEGKGG